MKALKNKMIWFGAILVTGIMLFVANLMRGDDSFIGGFSAAIAAVAALKMLQFVRIARNPEMLKRFQIAQQEERLIMLVQKSGYFTLAVTLMVEIFGGIILMFLGKNQIANALVTVAAVQSLFYMATYFWLSKKY